MRTALLAALAWALLIPAAIAAPAPRAAAKGSAASSPTVPMNPILQSRAIRPTKPRGGKRRKDPPEKYFRESSFHPHYDGRFATKEVAYADRKTALIGLVRSYLTSMNEIGIQTWIMHGSLLGWWWNKRIMPWDTDLDVMVSEQAMEHLASYYNMTIHHHRYDDGQSGRDYMLEINPHFRNTSEADKYNRIDARWVDTKTGLFIDITTLHRNVSAEAEGKVGAMMSKDRHHYDVKDIFPLRETVFEDTPCLVPYGYTELLIEEYGPMSLIKRDFANHHFDQLTMEWLPVVNPKGDKRPDRKKLDEKAAEARKAEEAKKKAESKKAEDRKLEEKKFEAKLAESKKTEEKAAPEKQTDDTAKAAPTEAKSTISKASVDGNIDQADKTATRPTGVSSPPNAQGQAAPAAASATSAAPVTEASSLVELQARAAPAKEKSVY